MSLIGWLIPNEYPGICKKRSFSFLMKSFLVSPAGHVSYGVRPIGVFWKCERGAPQFVGHIHRSVDRESTWQLDLNPERAFVEFG
jgi:hypothetical protein